MTMCKVSQHVHGVLVHPLENLMIQWEYCDQIMRMAATFEKWLIVSGSQWL